MTDCRRWLDEVEYAIPTVVFAVREGLRDLEDVLVTRNGKLIANRLDGRAVAVDPGKQRFVFELKGNRQRTVDALIVEGEKSRVIAVEVSPPDEVALTEYGGVRPPPALAPKRPLSAVPLVFAGVGAVALGSFTGFAVAGWRQETSLADRCAPRCTDAEVQSVRRKYLLADISLGVGVGALAVAGYLYLRDPYQEPTPALTLAIQPRRDAPDRALPAVLAAATFDRFRWCSPVSFRLCAAVLLLQAACSMRSLDQLGSASGPPPPADAGDLPDLAVEIDAPRSRSDGKHGGDARRPRRHAARYRSRCSSSWAASR